MGGDGGTLNNSRHELTQLRQSLLRARTRDAEKALARARASTTHCALSHAPLQPPHVVVDRLGNLYNKDALLTHLLERAGAGAGAGVVGGTDLDVETGMDALPHIRSVRRDVAPVTLVRAAGRFVCPVSRKDVLPDARCSVGWLCGCVTADLHALRVAAAADTADPTAADAAARACLNCGRDGPRIALGQTRADRDAALQRLLLERAARHKKKRARAQARGAAAAGDGETGGAGVKRRAADADGDACAADARGAKVARLSAASCAAERTADGTGTTGRPSADVARAPRCAPARDADAVR